MLLFLASLVPTVLAQIPVPAPDTSAMEPQVAVLLGEQVRALRRRPHDGREWIAYGEVLHAHGRTVEAALCYREADRLVEPGDPNRLTALYLLAHAVRSSAPAEAVAALERAVAEQPGYPPAWLLLGEIRSDLADAEGAEEAFVRALDLEPDSALARFRLGSLRLGAGRPKEAVPLLEAALAAAPEAGAIRAALAQALFASGQRDRAREFAGGADESLPAVEDPIHFRMTERDISSPRLLARARAAREADRLGEAERLYRDLRELRPSDAAVLAGLAAVLDDSGRRGEAAPLYRDAIALDPDQPLARFGLGTAALRGGDLTGAEFQFRRAVAARPEEAHGHAALGDVLLRQGRVEEGLDSLEAAARLDPEDGVIQVLTAVALAELGRYDEAWDAVADARRLGAEPPEGFLRALRAKRPEPGR